MQPSSSKSLVLALCCLAQFMVVLDVSIVNVALPSIRRDLGFSAVDLQWVVNAYTLTFAGFLLLSGRAADLLGPRRALIAGPLRRPGCSPARCLSARGSTSTWRAPSRSRRASSWSRTRSSAPTSHGWTSAPTLLVAGAGLALLATFVGIEGRLAARALMPLRVFRSRSLTGANLVVFALGSSAFAMWYFLSLYLQQVLGYGALDAGLAFLPMTVALMVASQVAGRLVGRFGPGVVLTSGMALIGAGMLLCSGLPTDGTYVGDVLAPALLTAIGFAFAGAFAALVLLALPARRTPAAVPA